jgi:hypothetical protein
MKLGRCCPSCRRFSLYDNVGPVTCPRCGRRWSIRWKKGEQAPALAELRLTGDTPHRHRDDLARTCERHGLTPSQRAAMDVLFRVLSREPPPGEPLLVVSYDIAREHRGNVITVRATCTYAGEPADKWRVHVTARGHIDVLDCPVRYRKLGGTVAFGLHFAKHLAL